MPPQEKSISRKLISIIIIAMIIMAAAIATVIGISGYANLESITRDNIERSANVIAEHIARMSEKSHAAINSIEQLSDIHNLLVTESNLGPYYHESSPSIALIDAPEQILKLKAQLELVNLLRPIMLARDATSLSLYHVDSFALGTPREPAFSLRLTPNSIELGQYSSKDKASLIASTILNENQLEHDDLFDVSAIYEHELNYFLTELKAKPLALLPIAPAAIARSSIDRLIVIDNKPIIQTAAYLNISTPHPDNWSITQSNAYIIVVEQQITEVQLLALKELVNADIALLVEGNNLINTLNSMDLQYNSELKTASTTESFFVAARKAAFSSDTSNLRELEILVLSPVSFVSQLNFQLFIQILMVIVCGTLMVCIVFYLAIAKIISLPLTGLLKAVEHLSHGELINKIKIEHSNEIGRLAHAFNQMSSNIHEKRVQLKSSHNELKELLEHQGKELKSTQDQLIEAEKMSSLGELVAGVSHEVSTPIGICITAESFFHDETLSVQNKFNDGSMSRQDFTKYMETALENSSILSANLGRTAELIKNFKQIAVDQCIEDIRPIVVFRYIENLLSTLKPRIKSLKHKITITGDETIEITSYPGAIAQIVTNLIMNSIIHGFDGIDRGRIHIDITDAGERGVLIIYKDDGKGMSAQAQEKIFDPFFTTRKGKGGTGLGMNIVYKLITDTLQGEIKCSSKPNQGIRFDILIANQLL